MLDESISSFVPFESGSFVRPTYVLIQSADNSISCLCLPCCRCACMRLIALSSFTFVLADVISPGAAASLLVISTVVSPM